MILITRTMKRKYDKTKSFKNIEMRIAVLFEDRCKPNSPAFEYLQKYAGSCGAECIQVDENDKCKILEDACPPCLMRAKNCPGDAVKVINLPEELETDMIHRYSLNGFRLFRLPTPSKDSIIGILGPNGMGKSTAFNILNGSIIPNLGEFESNECVWEDVIETLPRGELRDFLADLNESTVKVALKPQYVDHIPKAFKGNVGKLLSSVNERGLYDEMIEKESSLDERDRMDFVSIVTPNHLHFDPAIKALNNGFPVIIDKPMTFDSIQAESLVKKVNETKLPFAVTHTYTGYPMVKEAKSIISSGKIGKLRKVAVEYPQGWLTSSLEKTDNKLK